MIITIEDKTASVTIGGETYSHAGGSALDAAQNLLFDLLSKYQKLSNVNEVDLTPAALERKKLLQEIVE